MFELECEEAPMWTLLYRDLWGPVWPNLAASVLWTLPALWWHHRRMKTHVTKTINEAVSSSDGSA